MIHYQNEIKTKDNLVLSVDNIVFDLYISRLEARDRLVGLLDRLPMKYAVDIVNWNSFRPGTFREQFQIKMQDGNSFWIGFALNGNKTNWGRVRIDFNPNKVAHHEVFRVVMQYLIANTHQMHREIKRYDLAIDIPVERYSCFLNKDRRAYIERRHGKEWTQYLGAKSSVIGRVKLYNKQVESKLDYPLTRLELTLEPGVSLENVNFPIVYYLDDRQVHLEEIKITDTERFILNALLQGCGSLTDLGRKTREKIEKLMSLYVKRIGIEQQDYNAIQEQLRTYVTGMIQFTVTDFDQVPHRRPRYPDWVTEAEALGAPDEVFFESTLQEI